MSQFPINIIASAYDRLEEAHWNIHQMEQHYHESEPFRYSLNSFLRVIKEVPQILQMELQNKEGFTKWYKERRQVTNNDPLISYLFKARDIVVHKSMLKPKSSAYLGITEGRNGLKLGMGMKLDPFEDSDILLLKFLFLTAKDQEVVDVFGILGDDEESWPCIERHWGLDPYEEGILELAVQAWEQIASLVSDTVEWLGEDPSKLHLSLNCMHSTSAVAISHYNRKWIEILEREIKTGAEFYDIRRRLYQLKHGM
ncbi:hypothetical protein LAV82_17845 [Bacillus sp. ILBB4]|nr:hypothetical protein [Bacillus sp. ILBB4]